VHPYDLLLKADLLDPESVIKALNNTKIAYLTVGLPLDSEIWLRDWVLCKNVITACKKTTANSSILTYAYDQNSKIQTEETLSPLMGKGRGKKLAAELLLKSHCNNRN
jgi:hypothetical protein